MFRIRGKGSNRSAADKSETCWPWVLVEHLFILPRNRKICCRRFEEDYVRHRGKHSPPRPGWMN